MDTKCDCKYGKCPGLVADGETTCERCQHATWAHAHRSPVWKRPPTEAERRQWQELAEASAFAYDDPEFIRS